MKISMESILHLALLLGCTEHRTEELLESANVAFPPHQYSLGELKLVFSAIKEPMERRCAMESLQRQANTLREKAEILERVHL
jgi:hypothetical protein